MLSNLSEEELTEVWRDCHGLAIKKATKFVGHEESSRDVYFIISGRVRINVYTYDGRLVTYEIVEPGETVGELAALDGKPRSASIEAEDDIVVGRLSHQDFMKLLANSPHAASATFQRLAYLVRWLSGRLYENYALNAHGRLYVLLIQLGEEGEKLDKGVKISNAPTDRDLASRINAARELVNREMSTLRKAGVLKREGRTLWIFDMNALHKRLEKVTLGES